MANAPAVLKRSVTEVEARHYELALAKIGARVRLEDASHLESRFENFSEEPTAGGLGLPSLPGGASDYQMIDLEPIASGPPDAAQPVTEAETDPGGLIERELPRPDYAPPSPFVDAAPSAVAAPESLPVERARLAPPVLQPGEMSCPKCGKVQPVAPSCFRCGIIVARFDPARPRRASTVSGPPSSHPPAPVIITGEPASPPPAPVVKTARGTLWSGEPIPDEGGAPGEIRRAASIVRDAPAFPALSAPAPREEDASFWGSVPTAFIVPFMGKGIVWIPIMIFALCLAWISGLWLKGVFFFAYLGLLANYFASAIATGLEGEVRAPPPPRFTSVKADFVLPGAAVFGLCLALFAVPASTAYWAYSAEETPPGATLLVGAALLIPLFYWPMALTIAGLAGRPGRMFDLFQVIRYAARGGLRYTFVVAVGFALIAAGYFAGAWYLAETDSFLAAFLGVSVFALAMLGYAAAVQGHLMGRLIRSDPEKFGELTPE